MEPEIGLWNSVVRYGREFCIPVQRISSKQRWVIGLLNLASVVVLWVGSSFLVSILSEDGTYRKPFFITYLNTSFFSLYFLHFLRTEGLSLNEFIRLVRVDYKSSKIKANSDFEHRIEYGSNDDLAAMANTVREIDEASDPISYYETIKLSLHFSTLWFLANLVTNGSLSYTSVASQTILSSTSSFFTLIVGYICSVEQVSRNKILGILLSFAGVSLVTEMDWSAPNNGDSNSHNARALFGNLLALLGAVIYGLYTILLKLKTKSENGKKERLLNTHLFFGFVGIYSLVFLWPLVVVLHVTKYEVFELPSNWIITAILLGNTAVTFISDFCWCNAVLLTSPLTVTVGLTLTIPLSMIGDWTLKHFAVSWPYIFGASIVIIGFLIINRDEKADFVED